MIWLLPTLVLGGLGGLLFWKLKVPAGAMVGAMVVTSVFSVATGRAHLPQDGRLLTQMVAGAYIGASIQYKDVLALRRIILPAFLMIFLMISLDIGMGFILFRTTSLSLPTALMASAPGGLMDISLMAADVGADPSSVAILQLLRLTTVMSFFPVMLTRISRKLNPVDPVRINETLEVSPDEREILKNQWYLSRRRQANFLLTLIIAFAAGAVGVWLAVPAGALTFAMLFTAVFNVFTGRGYLPDGIRYLTQVLAGILIGVRMTWADLVSLRLVLAPALLMIAGLIIINLIVGYLLHRLAHIELVTSLIASVPGGVSDMALIARDLGGDQSKVAVLQLFRYVFVVAVYPVIIRQLMLLIA